LIYKYRSREFKKYGIWGRCAAVLEMATRMGEQATQAAIVNETHFERNTISEQLSRMEKDGIIDRRRDLNRKNAIRIEITEKGREIFKSSQNRESLDSAFSTLTEEEKLELWRIISKIRENVIKDLNLKKAIKYPPSDPREFLTVL
jgi:DNA-binding MarR family transcriptional regulator